MEVISVARKIAGLCTAYVKTSEYKQLRQELLNDLQSRGLISQPYTDKVEEYMSLWCLKKILEEDIASRGVYVEYQNGANQRGTTDNKSVEKLVRVSSQMLNIWTALGFREQANNAKPTGGDDDEL